VKGKTESNCTFVLPDLVPLLSSEGMASNTPADLVHVLQTINLRLDQMDLCLDQITMDAAHTAAVAENNRILSRNWFLGGEPVPLQKTVSAPCAFSLCTCL
jgi:hypothetical protein